MSVNQIQRVLGIGTYEEWAIGQIIADKLSYNQYIIGFI